MARLGWGNSVAVVAVLACASLAQAQTPATDRHAHTARLRQYEAAIDADSSNYEALWNAAGVAVDLGEFDPDRRQRDALFAQAEVFGRRAVAVNPHDAEGHFELARALGRKALTLGVRDRARYAVEVREQALAALISNPKHPGALHVLGVWNQQVMQLNALQRTFAKTFLGAKVFGKASWDEAVRSLQEAVAVDPDRIVHRLDLGRLYAARKRTNEARDQFLWIMAAPITDFNDPNYKREAEAALKAL